MITELKSGWTWEFLEEEKLIRISRKNTDGVSSVVVIPRVQTRSLLCFLNRVAWHKDKKKKK